MIDMQYLQSMIVFNNFFIIQKNVIKFTIFIIIINNTTGPLWRSIHKTYTYVQQSERKQKVTMVNYNGVRRCWRMSVEIENDYNEP